MNAAHFRKTHLQVLRHRPQARDRLELVLLGIRNALPVFGGQSGPGLRLPHTFHLKFEVLAIFVSANECYCLVVASSLSFQQIPEQALQSVNVVHTKHDQAGDLQSSVSSLDTEIHAYSLYPRVCIRGSASPDVLTAPLSGQYMGSMFMCFAM